MVMTPEYYREVRERIVSRLAELEATALADDPMDSDGFWGSSHGARSIVYLRCELVRLEREWREAAERAEASLVVTPLFDAPPAGVGSYDRPTGGNAAAGLLRGSRAPATSAWQGGRAGGGSALPSHHR